jgi:hypothetical protein
LKSIASRGGDDKAVRAVLKIWERALGSARSAGVDTTNLQTLVRIEPENHLLVVKAFPLQSRLEGKQWHPFHLRPQWQARVFTYGNLEVFFQESGTGKRLTPMPERALGAFLLAHEFVRIDTYGSQLGSIIPKPDENPFFQVIWNQRQENPSQLTFHWVIPEWDSYLDWQRFLIGWRKRINSIPHLGPEIMDRLAWAFLDLIVRVCAGMPFEHSTTTFVEPNWKDWSHSVVEMARLHNKGRSGIIANWMSRHATQLATPEAGTSTVFAQTLLDSLSAAYGREWKHASKLYAEARFQRIKTALQVHQSEYAQHDPSSFLDKINAQFQAHPFIRKVPRGSSASQLQNKTAAKELIDQAMRAIDIDTSIAKLLGRDERDSRNNLKGYMTTRRQRLLELNEPTVLVRLSKTLQKYREIRNSANHAALSLWEEIASSRKPRLKSLVTMNGDRLVLAQTVNPRQQLHSLLQSQWSQLQKPSKVLSAPNEVKFYLESRGGPERPLVPAVPLGMDAILRLVYDFTTDQDDLTPASPPQLEWWPHVKVELTAGVRFAPWPAIPWPTLWEWEELREEWKEASRQAKLLARSDTADSSTTVLDTLADWLLSSFDACRGRHQPRGSSLRTRLSQETW